MIFSQVFGRTREIVCFAALFALALGICGAAPGAESSDGSAGVARASFTEAGEAQLPVGYRQWVHVGTRLNAKDRVSILDGKPTRTPEVLDAYVEPGAFAAYEKTGKWPDGSQMVKEFSAVRIGTGCQTDSLFCTTKFGYGIYETGYTGLGYMVKDEKRFPDAPGHWGFFHFGHHPPPYEAVSPLRPAEQCSGCHVRLASDTDFVISRAHIGLARNP